MLEKLNLVFLKEIVDDDLILSKLLKMLGTLKLGTSNLELSTNA